MAKVLVTGATGFIAGHTILKLIEDGHEVRGTVRSKASADKLFSTLSRYAGKDISFEIFEANLSSNDGWADAIDGCDYVQHLASPLPAILPKNHDELIIPAKEGALRVLKAARENGKIARVVMTASVAAIAYGWGKDIPDLLTEKDWSNPDNMADNTAYTRSKAIAEKAAWDYVNGEGKGLELTTINPSLVLGPVMSGDFSASVEAITQLMGGKVPAIPKLGFQIVDVRDVADAHVLAMTHPDAAGERFAVSESFLWFDEVAHIVGSAYPDRNIPKGRLPSFLVRLLAPFNPPLKQIIPELGMRRFVSNEKAKSMLGWQPRSAKEAILSSAKTLIETGEL